MSANLRRANLPATVSRLPEDRMRQLNLSIQPSENCHFGHFLGADNQEIIAQLSAFARSEESSFIYLQGAADTGKTHLCQAVLHEALAVQRCVIWLPLKEFSLEPQILDGLDSFDIVILDDLGAILPEQHWEIGLFNLYNQLQAENKSLLVTAQSLPRELGIGLPDLTSRLGAMLHYRTQLLDDSELRELMKQQAEFRGLELSDKVIGFLMRRVSRANAGVLEVMRTLDSVAAGKQRVLTVPFAKQVLGV